VPKLYIFSLLGPPQNSEELPLQGISQPLEARAPPLENVLPQSRKIRKRPVKWVK